MNLIHEIINAPWFIEKNFSDGLMPAVAGILKGQPAMQGFQENEPQAGLAFMAKEELKTVNVSDIYETEIKEPSIFTLRLAGAITKYDQLCGPIGCHTKSKWLKHADNHPQVRAHLIIVDSGGGSGYAARLMEETIKSCKKPVVAFIEDTGASAAYWISCAAEYVFANSKMARVGSIGTYITIDDYREFLKMEGVSRTEVYAEKSKDKNLDYRQAIDGKTDLVQKLVDEYNEFFLKAVEQNRKGKLKQNNWSTGKMFFAEDARRIGLIDDIMTIEEILGGLLYELTN